MSIRVKVFPVLFVCMFLLIAGGNGFAAENSYLLNESAAESEALQKYNSNDIGTSLGFQLGGITTENVSEDGVNYKKIIPITGEEIKFGETSEVGLPNLPVYAHLLGIPDQSGATVQILSSSFEIIENIDVYPTQTPVPEASAEILPFVKDNDFYSIDRFYPENSVELGEPIICRDLRMIQVVINPIQYNPVTRQLKVYTSIDYDIVYEGTDSRNMKFRNSNTISESFLPLYRSLVPNADEMLAAYEPIRGGYLIITPDNFADSAQVFADWKHKKGYDVVIATASEVDPNGSAPTAVEVFNYIQNAYYSWEIPPDYVCIFGDENLSIPDYPYGGFPSDHKYSCVDGDDYLSDIMVTRMSVNNSLAVLSVAMQKSLTYERNPYMTDPSIWERGLSVAGNVSATTPRITVLWVRTKLLEHGYAVVDTSFRWASGQSDPNLLGFFNQGPSIIQYRGWAGSSGWYSPSFDTGDLAQIQNHNKLGIMASLVCGTGNFGSSECFGERWIRMGASPSYSKGGPGFYGVSDGNTHTKWNNPVMIGYYWGLLEEGIHHFATAAFRGKMQQYNTFPRYNASGQIIEQYFNTYNTLGDPEIEMRTTIPKTMNVTYPTSIPVGTNYMQISVTGEGGGSLENAYVCLLKESGLTDEVFVGGRTDQNGIVVFDYLASTAGTMNVTVTARNYIPHEGTSNVLSQNVAVGVNAIAIDDDNSGGSSGNNDGNVNPSEIIEFSVTLRNFGTSTTATGVSATISATVDQPVSIVVPTQSYGSIAPGATATSGAFVVDFDDYISNGDRLILTLDITSSQGSWTAAVPVDILSMYMAKRTASYPGNPNNRLDPGETSTFVISLENLGDLDGTSLQGTLSTLDPTITILDGSADFGNIAIDETGSNSGSPFTVLVGEDVYNGHNVNFNLELLSSNGSIAMTTFSIVIGNVSTFDPVGPDNYGYYLYDNTDSGYDHAPFYNWVEINTIGTRINFVNTDDAADVISGLPFDIVYYGETYDYILVCTNGFVAFDTAAYDMGGTHWYNFDNKIIPEPGAPSGLIGPFWDDLEYSGSNGVFHYYDSANHRYIIEWSGMTHARTGSPQTFEMIIYDPAYYPTPTGDAEIVFQYQTVNNDDDNSVSNKPGLYATVGMQSPGNDDGLQYTFDNYYHPGAAILQSGRAIKITTATGVAAPPELVYDPSSFFETANVGQIVTSDLTISNIAEGTLVYTLRAVADNGIVGSNPMALNLDDYLAQTPIGYQDPIHVKSLDKNKPIYPPVITNQGGPDTFGNTWVDSDELGGPVFDWIDISGVGTPVTLSDDNSVGPISIGFNFPFYENTHNSLYICSNGLLTFGVGSSSYSNQPMPASGTPNNMLCPLWDDLNPSAWGEVYYYFDSANSRFIVSYVGVPFWYSGEAGTGFLTFQVILYPSGHIVYQYDVLDPGQKTLTSLSIGIENSSGTDGLQVVYDAAYLTDSLAVRFYTPSFWLSIDSDGGILAQNESDIATVTFDATDLSDGVYTGHIGLTCNDPNQSEVNIPLTFTVGQASVPDISFESDPIIETLSEGESTIRNFMIRNYGTADLLVDLEAIENSLRLQNENQPDLPVIDNIWLFIDPATAVVTPGDSITAQVTLNATTLTEGVYLGEINIDSNDPDTPTGTVQITLNVEAGAAECYYTVGDVNESGSFNGLDVTYAVGYFKGGSAPPYTCECSPGNTWFVAGDVNGSCSLNGLDVTYSVAYFKGGPGPIPCPTCPPASAVIAKEVINLKSVNE